MPKELNKDVESVMKTMYGQNENIKQQMWHTSVIPALRRLWQARYEFKVENLRRQQKKFWSRQLQ
jgi:mannose/fructose/N-acetylgalactosamine-specific phosphotransferase system component IID